MEVKGLPKLIDSFKLFVEKRLIREKVCEKCNKANSVVRRVEISELPNVLLIPLKRFVKNKDTQKLEKINSRLEFPMELNLTQFMKKIANVIPEYFKYELLGTIVHSGYA